MGAINNDHKPGEYKWPLEKWLGVEKDSLQLKCGDWEGDQC